MAAAGDWRQGLQLALAVLAATAASVALRLPEGLWAAMSALIVLRPTAGATAAAGWDRVRGMLAGTALALVAVACLPLLPMTAHAPLAMLGAACAIAFCAGLHPSLRSAPVSALIVLAAAAGAGHSALQAALVRGVEIGAGVTIGLAVSWVLPGTGARRRFRAACAAVLRQLALQVGRDLEPAPADEVEAERSGARLRRELRALAVLAANADHEGRLASLARRAAHDARACGRIAHLVARAAHDAALFGRLADTRAAGAEAGARQALAAAIAAALNRTAEAFEGEAPADAAANLGDLARAGEALALPWASPALALLTRDLAGLLREHAAHLPSRLPSKSH